MQLPLFIARRYLFAPKSHQAVNLITGISFIGVSIITAALVVVLSVFNGFEGLINSLYSTFDPDIKITATQGKFIDLNENANLHKQLKANSKIRLVSYCLEEQALLRYRDKQYIARIKGVDSNFVFLTGIDKMVREGTATLQKDSTSYAIMGMGVAYYLGAGIEDYFSPVQLFVPNRNASASINPAEAFSQSSIVVKGIFSVEQSFDVKYVLVPLDFAAQVLKMEDKVSSIEIGLKPGENANEISKELSILLGDKFTVKTRSEQNEALFKVLQSEKFYGFLIVCFIFLLAVINVAASMIMLIIEKKNDTAILQFMGADQTLVKRIFLNEGMLIIAAGLAIGLGLGSLLCWIQTTFGLIKLQDSGSFVVDYYPVVLKLTDIVLVTITVLSIGLITVWGTVSVMLKPKKLARI